MDEHDNIFKTDSGSTTVKHALNSLVHQYGHCEMTLSEAENLVCEIHTMMREANARVDKQTRVSEPAQ